MEANAAVYVSDDIVRLETKEAPQSGVVPLESVPYNLNDWHPGSDSKVHDIVHPSLYSLMYGKSKYLVPCGPEHRNSVHGQHSTATAAQVGSHD